MICLLHVLRGLIITTAAALRSRMFSSIPPAVVVVVVHVPSHLLLYANQSIPFPKTPPFFLSICTCVTSNPLLPPKGKQARRYLFLLHPRRPPPPPPAEASKKSASVTPSCITSRVPAALILLDWAWGLFNAYSGWVWMLVRSEGRSHPPNLAPILPSTMTTHT